MIRRFKIAFLSILTVLVLAYGGAGQALLMRSRTGVGHPPKSLPVESVQITTSGSDFISGWFIPGKPTRGAVLLLHGVRGNRHDMVGRAQFLHQLGYSVLLIDLPAHGESTGAHITYGLNEAEGVRAALQYLRKQLPEEKVGVIGASLGAASLVLAKPDPAPSAVILESMFPTIREALSDRLDLYLGRIGDSLAPVLLWQLPLRLGISPDQLRPIADMASLKSPVLIISGGGTSGPLCSRQSGFMRRPTLPRNSGLSKERDTLICIGFNPPNMRLKSQRSWQSTYAMRVEQSHQSDTGHRLFFSLPQQSEGRLGLL